MQTRFHFPRTIGCVRLFFLLALVVPTLGRAESDTAKWLVTMDARWQANYQRDVAGPFEKGIAELRRQYLASLATPLAAATQAGRSDEAALWTAEQQSITSGGSVPPYDAPSTPRALKTLRATYREQFARLDKQRFERARALFGQCDAVLTKNQAALTERNRTNEAAELQKERDQLRTAWLQPPAAPVAAGTPAPGASGAAAKLTVRQVLEKLLALGAVVSVKVGKADPVEIKSVAQIADQKFTFWRVELRPERSDQTPLAAADYAILDSLAEVSELALNGENVTDAVLEKLRPWRALQTLTIGDAKITAASFAVLPPMPELRELYLANTGTGDDALKTIAQCRKIKNLHLVAQPVTDDGLASLSKMPALEELELNQLEKLGSPGFAHLADCRALREISATGFPLLTGMVENLGHCKNLENLFLPGSVLKDAEIAPLSGLAKLRLLNLEGSAVSGAAFATWPLHSQLMILNLTDAAGVDDAALKSIEHVFPKLTELDVKTAATGFSAAGTGSIAKLRALQTLRLAGDGITDEVVAPFTHLEALTTLAIPAAKLGDPGAASLGKLIHLSELSIDVPPLSDLALKSLARCKELKTVNIGKDALPETEAKLQRAIAGVVVHRPQE
jgi:hypothetical protein